MPGHTRRHSTVSYAKMAESIDLLFGLWTLGGWRSTSSIVFARLRQSRIWRIRFNRPSAAAMRLMSNYF